MTTISTAVDASGGITDSTEKGLGSDIDRVDSNNGTTAMESIDPAAEQKLLLKLDAFFVPIIM